MVIELLVEPRSPIDRPRQIELPNSIRGLPVIRRDGSILGMAKEKVTISLDRRKADKARALVAARSTSEVIDLALERLIDSERLRRDIAAYRRVPPNDSEGRIAEFAETSGLADETDWEGLYREDEIDR